MKKLIVAGVVLCAGLVGTPATSQELCLKTDLANQVCVGDPGTGTTSIVAQAGAVHVDQTGPIYVGRTGVVCPGLPNPNAYCVVFVNDFQSIIVQAYPQQWIIVSAAGETITVHNTPAGAIEAWATGPVPLGKTGVTGSPLCIWVNGSPTCP